MNNDQIEERIKRLEDFFLVQCQDGNWDYNRYMHGFTNGLAVAISVITGEEPTFLDAPALFTEDAEMLDKLSKHSVSLRIDGH